MASMIEHSKFVSMHHMKQEWEDEMVKEDDEKIKAGLTKKCMNCHKPLVKTDKITLTVCNCVGHTKDKVSTYWGF
tara:strand:- start:27 stop:251 length:225 start_codon:yes stop_codon:yes gene_type:complete